MNAILLRPSRSAGFSLCAGSAKLSTALWLKPSVSSIVGHRYMHQITSRASPLHRFTVNRQFSSTGVSWSTTATGQSSSPPPSSGVLNKISRALSFSFYAGIIIGGVGVLGIVGYLFVSEVLLPTSDVALYNKTFSIIEKDPMCRDVLGDWIKAHGEESGNKWARSRPIASRRGHDNHEREHMWMQFHVEGEKNIGLVRLEMIKDPHGSNAFEYRYLVLEVPDHPRIYLIDKTPQPAKKTAGGLFWGIKWGPKKDED